MENEVKQSEFDGDVKVLTCVSSRVVYDIDKEIIKVTDEFVDENGVVYLKTDYSTLPKSQKSKLSVELPVSLIKSKFYSPKPKKDA